MSEFRGLHNPERHKGNQPDTRCVRCHGGYEVCAPDAPCYCCLAAEVQALREQVQRVRNAIAGGLGVSYYCPTDDPADDVPVWISIDVLLNIFDGGGDI